MKQILFAAVAVLLYSSSAWAQSAPVIFAESFRQGTVHITEDAFEAKLTPGIPTYRERIKDSRGTDRYEFTVTPRGPEGDTEITSWVVRLIDLRHSIYN